MLQLSRAPSQAKNHNSPFAAHNYTPFIYNFIHRHTIEERKQSSLEKLSKIYLAQRVKSYNNQIYSSVGRDIYMQSLMQRNFVKNLERRDSNTIKCKIQQLTIIFV